MKIAFQILVVLLLVWCPDARSENAWRDHNGKPIPESDSQKSEQGFSGMLLVTSDTDWREKWDTPPETQPNFTQASEVSNGGKLFVLTFFSNPQAGADGKTDVTCDMAVIRPDGTRSAEQADVPCFQTQLEADPNNVFLAPPVVEYLAEPSDQRGVWTVEMALNDKVRNVTLPLKTSFTVK